MIFISLDTVRADALGCYGRSRFETPSIDALATSGARFDQAITAIPETALSHWTLFTSVEPRLHGDVNRYGTSRYVGPLAQEIFKAHGYTTHAVVGGVTLRSDIGLARGFDQYDEDFAFSPAHLKRPGQEVTARATAFIRQPHDRPYFLFVHYFDAHFPYEPPPPWDKKYDPTYSGTLDGSDAKLEPIRDGRRPISARDIQHVYALYGGEVSFLDTQVASLLKALEDAGARDNTLVVLFSDHGESFEHGYYFNHADVLYDSTLRVPLILSFPGRLEGGVTVRTQVSTVDVLPTVLALLEMSPDVKFQGSSQMALLKGGSRAPIPAFSLTDPWREGHQESVRSEAYKLIVGRGEELYSLSSDPEELFPLKDAEAGDVLRQALSDYKRSLQGLEATLMGPPLPPRAMPSQEVTEQLKALGYVRGK